MQNFGLIEQFPKERDLKAVVLGSTTADILQPDRNWYHFLPQPELQKKNFDTWACVIFSALNNIEATIERKYRRKVNFSDRYTAVLSGTVPYIGNSLQNVADSFGNWGFALEEEWPFDAKTIEEYYNTPIPLSIIARAKKRIKEYRVYPRWVDWGVEGCDPWKLFEALKYGPIQVTVTAWGKPIEGVYQRTKAPRNHAVTLYKAVENRYWCIYDHYHHNIKKLAWDFLFGSAMQFLVYSYEV